MGRGASPGHVLHPFLLALYTNLAEDEAKLGVCVARTRGGDTEARISCSELQIRYAHPISPGCHQLYIVIVAKPYAWLQEHYF